MKDDFKNQESRRVDHRVPPQCLLPLLVPLPLQLRLPQLHLVYKQSFKHLHNHQQPHPSTYYRLDSHPINFVIAVRPVLEPFRRAACWFTLGIDPFTKLGDVLFTGVSEKIVPSTLGDLDEVNASMFVSAELDDPESRP